MEKGGGNIIFPIILSIKAVGKISSGKKGKVSEIWGKKIKLKNMGWGRI